MLSVVRPSSRCACRCLLQTTSPALLNESVAKRNYENPSTKVFKRRNEVGLVGAGKFPLIKRKHYILDMLPPNENYSKTIKCILTKEIEGIGLKGTLVEVTKTLFRNKLYPSGEAVYASPENMEHYESYRKDSLEEGLDYQTKVLMMKLAGFHLPVFMNTEKSWVLNADHIRVALRRQGIWLQNENIILPRNPVVQAEDFVFKLQIDNRLAIKVRGTVYSVGADGLPDPSLSLPERWGHPPLDPENPLEYLKSISKQRHTDPFNKSETADAITDDSEEK